MRRGAEGDLEVVAEPEEVLQGFGAIVVEAFAFAQDGEGLAWSAAAEE